MSKWISVKDKLPAIGRQVLIFNAEGIEIACLVDERPDAPDDMGHDSGWAGTFALPGRSFGAHGYQCPSQGEPTHWMHIPTAPENDDE